MKRVAMVAALAAVSGCARVSAVVTRIEPGGFRACSISSGDSQGEVVEVCGEPERRLASLSPQFSECWIYDTRTAAFALSSLSASGTAVTWGSIAPKRSAFAVCFESRASRKTGDVLSTVATILPVDTSTAP